jgi:DNA polymerase III epsilon subunit family exonuclease
MIAERAVGQYVAFDLETTGLVAETDRVVEVGAIRFDATGQELGRFECLVNPERRMAPAAQAIHGISDADLVGAPTGKAVFPAFLDFLGDPAETTLLAHNASFDARFLAWECARAGLSVAVTSVVDTLALARRRCPELRCHRLDALARQFNLDPNGPHRALADSRRVKGLWLALDGACVPAAELIAYPIVRASATEIVPIGWDTVADAIARGLALCIEYDGGTRRLTPRVVTPRAFLNRGGVPYLVAYCHVDSFEKTFRLDRVQRYEVVCTQQGMRSGVSAGLG